VIFQIRERECQNVSENLTLIRLQQEKKSKANQIATLDAQLQVWKIYSKVIKPGSLAGPIFPLLFKECFSVSPIYPLSLFFILFLMRSHKLLDLVAPALQSDVGLL